MVCFSILLVDAETNARQANDSTRTSGLEGFSVIPERGANSTLADSGPYFSGDIYKTSFTSTFIVECLFCFSIFAEECTVKQTLAKLLNISLVANGVCKMRRITRR